ncbi:hypothetical protein [Haliea sp. E17]|uniref:hypothetical protein n=1 Tax=Haliea sp. E17 TaxID=3401576 RepID=UPI003AAB8CF0
MDTRPKLASPGEPRAFGYQALGALAVLACLSACNAISPARMALPEEFSARATVREAHGIGGGTQGTFHLGGMEGSYRRSASRLEVFDVYDGRSASVDFTFGSERAACIAKERQLNFKTLNFSPKPMAYACTFTGPEMAAASSLELQESREGASGAFGQRQRLGAMEYPNGQLMIRSVHAIDGSAFEVNLPIGYTFDHDGRMVGAVEINGGITLTLDTSESPEVLRSAELAALALGLLWDTGEYD